MIYCETPYPVPDTPATEWELCPPAHSYRNIGLCWLMQDGEGEAAIF